MERKKRILVLGINCLPELTGIGKYTGEMVTWMAKHGHEVTVVTSFPYYPYWKVQEPYSGASYKREGMYNGNLTMYRCPMYIPGSPSGIKRLLHEATFLTTAFFAVLRLMFKKKFDIVISIAPPFHLGFLALFYRFFRGGKILYHIQDLQVDAAKELNMLPDWLFPIFYGMEKFILRNVDHVSSISTGMINRIKSKIEKEILFFPNWVDTDNFHPLQGRDVLKSKWGFRPEDRVVLYSGSIGEKQGLDVLIEIAHGLKVESFIQFVICGTGPYKEKLIAMADEMGLKNVHFLPLQRKEVFNDFLNMADVHLVLQRGDASDLVMPSKLTTILAVGGLSIVTANPGTSLHELIYHHDLGIVVRSESKEELTDAIKLACTGNFDEKRAKARIYAQRFLNADSIFKHILDKLNSNCEVVNVFPDYRKIS